MNTKPIFDFLCFMLLLVLVFGTTSLFRSGSYFLAAISTFVTLIVVALMVKLYE
jgi:hypothetical protein